jgi:phosphoribosyl 1,2-cyclic phosphate phosphodiesterase
MCNRYNRKFLPAFYEGKKTMLKITVMGCGASSGVPLIGCKCAVCNSPNPKNKRTRVSILVQSPNTTILVDTSPDMRAQCLATDISKVDAIIYTHAHADHVHGIDDVRSFNFNNDAVINAYGDAHAMAEITERFAYVFRTKSPEWGWFRPSLNPIIIKLYEPFKVGDIEVKTFEQQHGKGKTLGLRFDNFAYSTDTNGLPDEAFDILQGIDTWLVDCLRYDVAPTHAHLEMTLDWINRLKPKRAYLTHMSHEFDYDKLAGELPHGVFPAYDGLVVEV